MANSHRMALSKLEVRATTATRASGSSVLAGSSFPKRVPGRVPAVAPGACVAVTATSCRSACASARSERPMAGDLGGGDPAHRDLGIVRVRVDGLHRHHQVLVEVALEHGQQLGLAPDALLQE